MKTIINPILASIILFSPLAFAEEKSENKLHVTIMHKYKDVESGSNYEFKFKCDAKGLLSISNDTRSGFSLEREEADKFKALVEKMLKFGHAVHKNQITGVAKTFNEKELLPSKIKYTSIHVKEDVYTPFSKKDIGECFSGTYFIQIWNLRQLEEIAEIFDEKQKEVYKKYDLLKDLND